MILNLYKIMKNYCVYLNAKSAKIFLNLLKTFLRLAKTLRQAQYKLQTHQRKKSLKSFFLF